MATMSIVVGLVAAASAAAPSRPHIIIALADDFGWHNIGWRNPEIASPTLNRLAKDGIILDRHYTFKYCSPTRSSLLSGRLPLHVNQNNECNEIMSRSGIDLRMTLLPAKLKQAGYLTHMSGKGHLGARSPANLMINRGFDSHFGFLKGGEDHMTQRSGDDGNFNGPDLWHGKVPGVGLNGTYSTYLYTAEAVRVVRAHPLPAPFFLYLPFQVTHSPYEIPDGYVNSSTAPERQVINAMVAIMDEGVKNVTDALDEKSMTDDTLIVFSADNGGVTHGGQRGNNYPLRGQKTSSFEGGVRVTAFLWGGKNVLPDNLRGTTSNAFIHITDWYATLSNLVGVDPTDNAAGVPGIDSIDQWKVLMTPNASPGDSIRTEIPLAFCPSTAKPRGSDNCCPTAEAGGWKPNGTKTAPSEWRNGALIRQGPTKAGGTTFWKLVWGQQFGFGIWSGPFSPNASGASTRTDDAGCPSGCLFDLLADPAETNNLKEAEPQVFAQLLERQAEIGLTVHQTNYSDVEDADCISEPEMVEKYHGFLGPRCGVSL
eukprot:m.463235 g.463235  ORF g.463235 m.463235 type:complete len:540 (+) comp22965_c0_seq1:16-1635(+)